jgi:hypothetical protein
MNEIKNKNHIVRFPSQKRSTNAKDKDFCIECLKGAVGEAYSETTGIRKSKQRMGVNYGLLNGVLDEKDVERVVNPWNVRGATFPAKMQNYPIANKKIDLLVGEESRRKYDWRVMVVNPDAISQKETTLIGELNQLFELYLTSEGYSEEELQQAIQRFGKYQKYEFQDLRELRATHYLKYLVKKENLKIKWNKGFKDVLAVAEEIYCTDIVAGEPIVYKCDPQSITALRMGNSCFIEDADIIIEDVYQPFGRVIDDYYEYLEADDIKKLERAINGDTELDLVNYNVGRGPNNPIIIDGVIANDDGSLSPKNIDLNYYLSNTNLAPYDTNGNIRKVRVVWRSLRKVGEISWYDEDGNLQKKTVDEYYEPNLALGEQVKWFWINEWWEITELANCIYVKWGPRPIQFRSMANKSKCGSGYVGTIYNTNVSQARSLMDRMLPYQYLYDVIMYRTEVAFAKAKGKIPKLDMSRIPDGWNVDEWIYYAETMGWALDDPFNEGNKGAATGQLAGNMNQNSNTIDLDLGNYIQQHIVMLQFIEDQMGRISGVNDQREGQIDNRETVGGVERAVLQSSHITEEWFMLHDDTKRRVLEALLETAKYAWRDKDNEKLQYISDDLTSVITTLDGKLINEAEYGIMISSDVDLTTLYQKIEGLAQAGLQNDKITFATLLDIYFSDSVSSLRRKIETAEEESNKRRSDEFQMQQDIVLQEIQAKQELEAAKMDLEDRMNIRDNQTKILLAGNEENTDPILLEKLQQSYKKLEQDYKLKQEQLKELERHNKATEAISKTKSASKKL